MRVCKNVRIAKGAPVARRGEGKIETVNVQPSRGAALAKKGKKRNAAERAALVVFELKNKDL